MQKVSALSFNSVQETASADLEHPFDGRNIHPDLWKPTKKLFDDGHFSQSTFEAYKFVDNRVKKLSKKKQTGFKLMMQAFAEENPLIALADISDETGKDEQKGFQFLFAGGVMAIRNPRGHVVDFPETIDQCLDHLSFASMLLRRLDERLSPLD